VEWIDLPTGKNKEKAGSRGNFVAVGTFEPDIEIWDLDTIDSLYPNAILGHGGQQSSSKPKEGKKKKKKKASQKANDDYHVDAILSLAANRQHRNLLASSSADKTVKLWDLNTTTCAKSYSFHTDKACSLAWNSRESTILLSGAYDRTVVAADMRAPDAKVPRWSVESDVENVRWDPHDSNFFYVSAFRGINIIKLTLQGLDREWMHSLSRRPPSSRNTGRHQVRMDTSSTRQSLDLIRYQSHHSRLSRNWRSRQEGQTMEHLPKWS
jgi:periodic tryptophan protein 1